MRNIRFRAWGLDYPNCKNNKLVKRMFYYVGVDSFGISKYAYKVRLSNRIDYSQNGSKAEDYDGLGWNDFDVALMQYTGLKDKNGVEIYEGDVILVNINWGFIDGVKDKTSEIYEVEYRRFGFYPFLRFENIVKNSKTTYEVLGNVYENPALLEKKKGDSY